MHIQKLMFSLIIVELLYMIQLHKYCLIIPTSNL